MFLSCTTVNNGVTIHYLDSANHATSEMTPLLICPGLSETAEQYVDFVQALLPRRCVVLSFRGRGRSDTPLQGYDLQPHIADLEAVVQAARLERFHLFSYSRGVSYALGYARLQGSYYVQSDQADHPIQSLIIQDYPPEHRQMPQGWADDYIHNYLIPCNRISFIRPEAVHGIQHDSTQIDLSFPIHFPVLVMRGLLADSFISNHDLEVYKQCYRHLTIAEFAQSGHDIRGAEQALHLKTVVDFLDYVAKRHF
ncbi:alpha/beta fold hydrolase [Paenibacillus sp. 481]|uniref:alpha/beta fold hydrolase n=1 Tax=Paenibacillus sp. 481 TaxID=2835869 RepID=UPI001E51C97D|nr:alpha/beta hydrolase [Paenibacillus sp. 481]UHA72744.1 alpha/beta hydrolase [Paenibacillus sp. 481]